MRRLPGTHPANIRNRSSKHLGCLCGIGHKPAFKSMSNAALSEFNCSDARKERARRAKKQEKSDTKPQ